MLRDCKSRRVVMHYPLGKYPNRLLHDYNHTYLLQIHQQLNNLRYAS